MKKLVCILIALMVLSLAAGCNGAGTTATRDKDVYWPTDGWQTSTPEEQGMDASKLNALPDRIDSLGLAIESVVVVRNGYIVLEDYPRLPYDKDVPHIVHSVTKSFVSALIGIAIREGFLDGIDQRMVDLFPDRDIANLDSRKESVTLENILTMKVGLEWDEWRYAYTDPRNDYIKAIRSSDPVQYVLDVPMMEDPGVRWNYNGGTSHLLSALVSESTGQDTLAFAREHLFGPLGITDVKWDRDQHGIYYGGGGLYLTPRDMAKFGYLYLHNGNWDGKQVVPEDFVAEATKTHSILSGSRGYGYQSWWTYPQDGVYYAAGLLGQRIYVIPELDLVVVFTANMPENSQLEPSLRALLFDYIMAACNQE